MKKDILQIKKVKHPDLLVVTLFFIGIFSFLFFTGTLKSGYHFIDDHEMLNISTNLNETSFTKSAIGSIQKDLTIRFRPLYYLHRVIEMKIFGTDFFVLSVYTGMLALLTSSFFYLGARKLRQSVFEALLFTTLALVGSQSAIWWRLGPAETIGVFFLGLSFFFMTKCLKRERYKLNNISFITSLTAMSLCKESFIVIIPAFVVFKVWNEKKDFNITTKESFKNNKLLVLPLVIMFVELLMIKFVIGTNNTGYAGTTSSLSEFITGVRNIILNPNSLLIWIKLFVTLALLYTMSFLFIIREKIKEFTKSTHSLLIYVFFAMMVIIPEILMTAKSGMTERYLLPTTFGLAFLAIGIVQNTKQKIFRVFMMFAICIFIVISFNTAKTDAILFTESGKDANSLLSVVKDKSNAESKILLVADPVDRFEVSYSIKTYLSFYGFSNLYAQPVMKEYSSDSEIGLKKQWDTWFDGKKLKDMKASPDLIVIFDKVQTENFFSQSGVIKSEYENAFSNSESHAVYLKK